MSDPDKIDLLKTTANEVLISALKAGVGLIPFVGNSLAETVGLVGQRVIDRRQTAFYERVIHALEAVWTQLADVVEFKESFWTTFLHSLEIARRTHQEEKIEALKNAVLNAAKPTAPDDNMQHIFLNMVDDLTPLHMRLLAFLALPQEFGLGFEDYLALHALNPNSPHSAWEAIETKVAPSTNRDLIE